MANQISGRVIAVSGVQTVASADPNKAPLQKRSVYIDCTRYDPYTGERSQYENKPVLEFSGERVLEKVNPKLDTIKKGDVVTISFDIQGVSYQDKATGKTKNFTGIRAYDIEVRRTEGQQQAQQVAQHVAQKLNADPVQQDDGDNGLPF